MPFLPIKTYTAGTKQFTIFQDHYWTVDERGLTNAIYFDSNTAAEGTATVTTLSINKPTRTDRYNYVFTIGGTPPLVGQRRNYARAVTTATNSGVAYTGPIVSMSTDNFVRVIVRNAAASRACKLNISDGTNTEAYSFTTSSVANTWEGFTFVKGTGTATPGAVNYAAVTEINVTDDLTGATLDVAAFYSAAEEIAMPGQETTINLDCITTFGKTYTREEGEILCSQIVRAKTANKKSLDMEAETKETDLIQRAFGFGNTIVNFSGFEATVLAGTYSVATGADTITIPAGLSVASVVVNGSTLQKTLVPTANVQEGQWKQVTTTITVGAGLRGQPAEIFVYSAVNTPALRDDGLQAGIVGYRQITRITENGTKRVMILPRLQSTGPEFSFADDGDPIKFKSSALAVPPTDYFFIEYEV